MAAATETRVAADRIIGDMVQRIVKRHQPDKVILFGSYARGTAGRDSDVDLLVVMPVVGSRREKAREIYADLGAVGLPKDIIVATQEEIERYRDIPGTIIRPALLEGKVLYERTV